MTDAPVSGDGQLRDARPDGLCTQTFFRNHDVIGRCLRYASQRHSMPRVWDIGGGVLEPLLVAALCEMLCATGHLRTYSLANLDASPEVAAILQGAQRQEPWAQDDQLVVDEHGRLNLRGMAQVFRATHAEVNTWLTDPVAVSAQVQQWLDLGMGPYFGIPGNVCHNQDDMAAFLAGGLTPHKSLFTRLRHVTGDITSADRLLENEAPYDVVLSNYALQYPIWEGRGQQTLEQIEHHLAGQGVLQVANAYSAQQAFIALLAETAMLARTHCVEVSVREAFIVSRYVTDAQASPPRLVPRVDIFCTPEEQPISGIEAGAAQAFTEHLGGQVTSVANLTDLSQLMLEHTGLEDGSMMVFHAWWSPRASSGYACLVHRDVVLAFGRNPLRACHLMHSGLTST